MKTSKRHYHRKRRANWWPIALGVMVATVCGIGLYLVVFSQAATVDESALPYSVLIVAGQSNAAGSESLVSDPARNFDLFGAQKHPADTNSQIMWATGDSNGGTKPQPLNTLQLSNGNKGPALFGPEVGLARRLYDLGRRRIIILKVALGGQALAANNDQNSGVRDWNVASTNEAYSILQAKAQQLFSYMNANNLPYSVDGFYWVQGEADSTADFAPQYEANLRNLFTQARNDLHLNPSAQFVIGKTSSEAAIATAIGLKGAANACLPYTCEQKRGYDAAVRGAQQKVADTMPNVEIVDTLGLPRTGLQVHLSNTSQLQLGKLFADATELTASNKLPKQVAIVKPAAPAATATTNTTKPKPATATTNAGGSEQTQVASNPDAPGSQSTNSDSTATDSRQETSNPITVAAAKMRSWTWVWVVLGSIATGLLGGWLAIRKPGTVPTTTPAPTTTSSEPIIPAAENDDGSSQSV